MSARWTPSELGTAIISRALWFSLKETAEFLSPLRPGITANAVKCRMQRLPEPIEDAEREAA